MFLFITNPCFAAAFINVIQIHPMFLFILTTLSNVPDKVVIQIHPMFLFIDLTGITVTATYSFKYIPCFYLSSLLISGKTHLRHSNTSHVFIYHGRPPYSSLSSSQFKYIPCFYLSFFSFRLNN